MKRIVHCVPSLAWGGTEEVAKTLHEQSVAHGWQSSMDLPFTPGTPGVRAWRAWALASRPAVDVVHAHLPWPDRLGPALLAARARPLVVTFHLLPEASGWPRDRLIKLPSATVLRLAAKSRRRVRWVALSEADRAVLSSLLGAEVCVVRNAPPSPKPVVEAVSWPDGAVRLLSVGRLSWQKGFDRMLDALAPLASLPWCWSVIGDGEDRAALEARTTALGLAHRVRFLGARAASEGLCNAHLVLAPSRREGMPLVPLESAEAGVAVLASRIAPHQELYRDATDGLLPDDPAQWSASLADLIASPERRARLALAQRAVLGNTPREAMWAAYAALYASLLRPSL